MFKKKIPGVNIGSSSILLIFIILCLVSFATLSIVSSNVDYKLGQKISGRTISYYSACNEAEKAISEMDTTLSDIYSSVSSEEEYFSTVGHEKDFLIPISDLQNLSIEIEILYPKNRGDSFYKLKSRKVINNTDIIYDDSLPVVH